MPTWPKNIVSNQKAALKQIFDTFCDLKQGFPKQGISATTWAADPHEQEKIESQMEAALHSKTKHRKNCKGCLLSLFIEG